MRSVDVQFLNLVPRDRPDIFASLNAGLVVPLAHVDVVLPHVPNPDILAIDPHAGLKQHAKHPARVGLIPSDIHPGSLIAAHPTEVAA